MVEQLTPYDKGRRSGRIAIGETAGITAEGIKSAEGVKAFLEYMWGFKDAYEEFLAAQIPNMIPVETPDNPEMYRVLWSISMTIQRYAELLKERDRAIDMEAVASLSMSIMVKKTEAVLGQEMGTNIINAFKDAVDIETTTHKPGNGEHNDK